MPSYRKVLGNRVEAVAKSMALSTAQAEASEWGRVQRLVVKIATGPLFENFT